MRFFGYTLGDESVPMPMPTPEDMEKMGLFVEEVTKAGVLIATGGIAPTSMVGRHHEAVTGFERAAALAQNNRERQLSAIAPTPAGNWR